MRGRALSPIRTVRRRNMSDDEYREWFLSRTVVQDGHRLWTGNLDEDGYGYVYFHERKWRTHRLALHLFVGPVPDHLMANHVPGCRHRHCVEPTHIYMGTAQQNYNDRWIDGTIAMGPAHWSARMPERTLKGERNPAAKLTEADVRAIRARGESGATYRAVAAEFCISDTMVSYICRRKAWMNVP